MDTNNIFLKSVYDKPQMVISELDEDEILFYRKSRNKHKALKLCIFFGIFGAHKFYEDNRKMGYIYMFTLGLLFVGWIKDIIQISRLPDTYYIR